MIENIRIQEWSVEISVLQFILVLLALNTGVDLQVEFAGKEVIIVPICKKNWFSDLDCTPSFQFSLLFRGGFLKSLFCAVHFSTCERGVIVLHSGTYNLVKLGTESW